MQPINRYVRKIVDRITNEKLAREAVLKYERESGGVELDAVALVGFLIGEFPHWRQSERYRVARLLSAKRKFAELLPGPETFKAEAPKCVNH